MPAGEVSTGHALADDVVVRFPVWLDIGYRLNPVLYLAIYGQVGLNHESSDCGRHVGQNDGICNVEDMRAGFEALVHLTAMTPLDWWIGAGLAWERLEQRTFIPNDTTSPNDDLAEEHHQGPALDLQAGLDLTLTQDLRAGPFLAYTLGAYIEDGLTCPETTQCAAAGDTALHHWLTLGMRGTFGP